MPLDKTAFGDPLKLAPARVLAHAGVQLLYRAATANLAPLSGDEHTNLGWDPARHAFQTHDLTAHGAAAWLSLTPLTLGFAEARCPLDGMGLAAAQVWLDAQLVAHGLSPTQGIALDYTLPTAVADMQHFQPLAGLPGLAAWYGLAAEVLADLVARIADLNPGASAIRCWPHHFDLATYVSLEQGNAETARGIGVGLSPGDESYDQPYFYVNPWPPVDPDTLPGPLAPGRWHTAGFVGSVARGQDILALPDPIKGSKDFLRMSFDTGCRLLGIDTAPANGPR